MLASSIYISCFHQDFRSQTHHQGWVQAFIDTLQVLFSQSSYTNPQVYFRDNDRELTEVDKAKLATADIFIVILTANYHSSSLCLSELEFYTNLHATKNVFKVLKSELDRNQQPEVLVPLKGYEFFEYDIDAEITIEYSNTGRVPDYNYWVKLDDLVFGIKQCLKNEPSTEQIGVYLASTTIDQKQARDALARNLKYSGFDVYPKESHYEKNGQLKAKIEEDLSKCSLSVHLMGEVFGEVVNPEGDSLVSLENEVSFRYSLENEGLKRIVWVPRDLQVMETKQQTYLEYLRSHKERQNNSYYLETSFENLKAYMHELLSISDLESPTKTMLNQPSLFYASSGAHNWLDEVDKILEEKQYKVHTAKDFTYWSLQQQYVGNVDVLLLVNAPNNTEWLNNWLKILHKIKGYRRKGTEVKVLLVSDQSSTLLSNKNLSKFKITSLSDFQKNPANALSELL